LAHRLQANLVEVRLAGHGLKKEVMQASAEDWLQSVTNATDIAHRLGHQMIILGTSTGAPLGCWAAKALETQFGRPMAIVYMAPNFGIKQSYAWLLTLPGSEWFLPLLLGRTRSWTPESEAVAKYWSTSYPLQAVIEMQKVVRWFNRQSPRSWTTPMAIMLGDLDPTISAKKALVTLKRWPHPASCRLPLPGETTLAEHVFAGDICGPGRTQHCVNSFEQFIRGVMVSDRNETNPGRSETPSNFAGDSS
jgi:esterase/lipase